MSKHTWVGALFNENVLSLEVVNCKNSKNEQPAGLVISRNRSYQVNIDADEEFIVLLKVDGIQMATLYSHI